MPSPRPSRRPLRAAGALVLTAALAGGVVGCGGSDDEDTASTGAGAATSTASGTSSSGGVKEAGNAPAADEGAIREALRRSPAASKAAGTARISTEQRTIGISTKGGGTIDLADGRVLLEQTVGGGAAGSNASIQSYVEKGKAYVKLPGSGDWRVTDTPAAASDPLAQVQALEKADITKVGGTKQYDGKTCREFTAEIGLDDIASILGAAGQSLGQVPSAARIPVTSCIDDSGLTYASESSFDLKDIVGDALPDTGATKLDTRTSSKLLVTDYGSAPEPQRPAGIDDAQPLGTGSLGGLTAPTS